MGFSSEKLMTIMLQSGMTSVTCTRGRVRSAAQGVPSASRASKVKQASSKSSHSPSKSVPPMPSDTQTHVTGSCACVPSLYVAVSVCGRSSSSS